MAFAVRKGKMERKDAPESVLKIVDGDMTDKEIEDFAKTKHEGLPKHVDEGKYSSLKQVLKDLDKKSDDDTVVGFVFNKLDMEDEKDRDLAGDIFGFFKIPHEEYVDDDGNLLKSKSYLLK